MSNIFYPERNLIQHEFIEIYLLLLIKIIDVFVSFQQNCLTALQEQPNYLVYTATFFNNCNFFLFLAMIRYCLFFPKKRLSCMSICFKCALYHSTV
jgi:hypothetical protein